MNNFTNNFGKFTWASVLPESDMELVTLFIKHLGSFKDCADEIGVSPKTIRKKMEDVSQRVVFLNDAERDPFIRMVKSYARGGMIHERAYTDILRSYDELFHGATEGGVK